MPCPRPHPIVAAIAAFLLLAVPPAAPPARAALPPLYPRGAFFGVPERTAPALSPDGRYLSWVAPGSDSIPNVWIEEIGSGRPRQVTRGGGAGVFQYLWAADAAHILYYADNDGDENNHIYAVDLAGGPTRDLTPFPGAKAQAVEVDRRHPDQVLLSLNRRDPRVFDRYRVKLSTGEATLEAENPGDVAEWLADNDFQVRACAALDSTTADVLIRVRDTIDGPWRQLARWPFEKNSDINYQKLVAWGEDNRSLIVQNSLTSDKSEIKAIDLATGRDLRVIAANPKADVANPASGSTNDEALLLRDPDTGRCLAACFEYEKPEWSVLDPSVALDFDFLKARLKRPFLLNAPSQDRWIVQALDDVGPTVYSIYDRKARTLTELFQDQPALRRLQLAPMTPVAIKARDGLTLVGYLTLPVGVPARKLPLILNPHGGPWYRDSWGFNPEVQWMANRGYAVLQVNFRGSTGFGTKLLNAGNGQWGVGSMQNDVTDAVKWAIGKGIADPKRVGIMGWSYGGYCALSGVTFTPDLFACGVACVGPVDVNELLLSFPPYWGPRLTRWLRRVGDVLQDEAFNRKISPLYHVPDIRVPVLLAYGANDPRVKLEAAEDMYTALREHQRQASLVIYKNEGHGWARPENSFDFYGRAEEFLGRHLGGRVEPWRAIPGSSAEVR